jgi:polysaccharide biosynthesis protein PslG
MISSTWIAALAAGMLNYADCVGAHHNGYNIGPDVAFDATGSSPKAATAIFRGPFDNPHHSWSFYNDARTTTPKKLGLMIPT